MKSDRPLNVFVTVPPTRFEVRFRQLQVDVVEDYPDFGSFRHILNIVRLVELALNA